jgi:glycosyltransferase involved in cell wall biosynthesis
MKKLDICIPTLNRIEKLKNCIQSILNSKKDYDIKIKLYFSDIEDLSKILKIYQGNKDVICHSIYKYNVPNFWNNLLKNLSSDALCYINDDVLFYEDTIEKIFKYYSEQFSDNDGIMGLYQSNLPDGDGLQGAFGVIGTKYAFRFPEREVFCPDYFRFYADWELQKYAEKIGKFYFNKEVKIQHLHPSFNKELLDSTHIKVRQYLPDDKRTWKKRQSLGLLWGESHELIGR